MKRLKITTDEIRQCSLLTKEEVISAGEEILKSDCWWWIRANGFCKYYALGITKEGSIDDHDGYIYGIAAIRPALYLKRRLCTKGTRYIVFNEPFIAIAEDILLYCGKEIRSAYATRGEGYNNYDHSRVKEVVCEWYEKVSGEKEKPVDITRDRAIELLRTVVSCIKEKETDPVALFNRCGFAVEELVFLGYEPQKKEEKIEEEIVEEDVSYDDSLSLMPNARTGYNDWEEAVARWGAKTGYAMSDEDVESLASALSLNHNPAYTIEKNIELAVKEKASI